VHGAAAALVALVAALCGCATREAIFHHLPPETPAADNAAAIKRAEKLKADAASAKDTAAPAEMPPVTPDEAPPLTTYDPWARLNRFTYRFNARFDEALFLPVANGYRRFLPSPLRTGVKNFFANLREVDSIVNYALQGRLGGSVRSLGRFVINSTVGIGGLFDVAGKVHLPAAPTGLSMTLARWGMHPGPYLVIPLYGPSTMREGIGWAGDYGISYAINIADLYRGDLPWALGAVTAVDQRAAIDFRYYGTGSPFEYETIRFLYVRKLLIEDTKLHPPQKRNPAVPAGE
jgi:phospholipid-binding lipoprotein MlaA